MRFSFSGAEPALLDASSLSPDVVLLLDTFFQVLIWHGENIRSWRDQGYQEQAEYKNFRELLALPQTEAQDVIRERFPSPRFIVCDQGDSQSRILLAKVNPSITHRTHGPNAQNSVITDDVSFQVFMTCLKNFATQT